MASFLIDFLTVTGVLIAPIAAVYFVWSRRRHAAAIETFKQNLHESAMAIARLQEAARLAALQLAEGETLKERFEIEHTTLVRIVMWLRLTLTKIPGDFVTFDKNGCPIISGKSWGYSSRDGKITDLTPPVLEKGNEQRSQIGSPTDPRLGRF